MTFEEELAALCIRALNESKDDPEVSSDIIAGLLSSLAFCVVKLVNEGSARQELLTGIEQLLYEEVSEYVKNENNTGKFRFRACR